MGLEVRIIFKCISYILNYLVCGLCLSSGIVNMWKTKRFGNQICFHLPVREVRHLLCWVPKKELT
jgi:hypothetical protein